MVSCEAIRPVGDITIPRIVCNQTKGYGIVWTHGLIGDNLGTKDIVDRFGDNVLLAWVSKSATDGDRWHWGIFVSFDLAVFCRSYAN
jgi:hypothetical protein